MASMKRCTPTPRAPGVSVSGRMCSAIAATSSSCSDVSARDVHAPSGVRRASQPASTPATVDAERAPPSKRATRRSASRRSIAGCASFEDCVMVGSRTLPHRFAVARHAPHRPPEYYAGFGRCGTSGLSRRGAERPQHPSHPRDTLWEGAAPRAERCAALLPHLRMSVKPFCPGHLLRDSCHVKGHDLCGLPRSPGFHSVGGPMSKRRRHAALGRPYLPQPVVAWPAVGSPPTGRTSPCTFLSLLLLLAMSPLSAVRPQTGGGGGGTTPAPTTGTISGVVTAQETGAPLPGARVTVAGTALGADAATDGRYTIAAVPPGTYRLRARLIGHALMEMTGVVVAAGDTARADFELAPLAVTLQEVVVVGYGTQARKDITGSVASVAGEDLQRAPKANAIEAIKGLVPGVEIGRAHV